MADSSQGSLEENADLDALGVQRGATARTSDFDPNRATQWTHRAAEEPGHAPKLGDLEHQPAALMARLRETPDDMEILGLFFADEEPAPAVAAATERPSAQQVRLTIDEQPPAV